MFLIKSYKMDAVHCTLSFGSILVGSFILARCRSCLPALVFGALPCDGSAPCPSSARFRLMSAITSATTLSRFSVAIFRRVALTRPRAFSATLRGILGAQHWSQTCRACCFLYFVLHCWKATLLFCVWHRLQVQKPCALEAHARHSLAPCRVRCHAAFENLLFSGILGKTERIDIFTS